MCRYLCTLIILLSFLKVEAQFGCDDPIQVINLTGITNFVTADVDPVMGACCGTTLNNPYCRSISVILDPTHVGFSVTINGAPGSSSYRLNGCAGPENQIVNATFCAASLAGTVNLTICRTGQSDYSITITPVSASVADFTGTTLSGCSLSIPAAAGQVSSNIAWTNPSGNDPSFSYLSCTNCLNPTFSGSAPAGIYIYEVCSDYTSTVCPGTTFRLCRTVTINVVSPPTITCPMDVTVACQQPYHQVRRP